MQAVGSQFGRRDVVADVSAAGGLAQQVFHQAGQVLVGPADVPVAVQQRRQVGAVRPVVDHQAEYSGTHGMLVLSWGRCTMQAGPGLLTLHAEAPDPGSLARIQDLVAGRLEKFGRREQLTVTWHPVQARGPVSS